jgi:di/tricarboxylate transporter
MPWEAWATLAVVAAVLVALARNAAGPDAVLGGGALALMTLHVWSPRFPSPAQVAASFGNEALLAVAVLFVVAAGLTETGALSAFVGPLLGRPRASTVTAQARLMLPVATASGVMNNTPLVAMIVPLLTDWCRRSGRTPSKFFIPLSYAAILGGLTTLVGTSTTMIVQSMMVAARASDPDMPVMGMFTITPVGVPVAIAGIGFVLLASRWLLPERVSPRADLANARAYTAEMTVLPRSPIDGRTIEEAGLRHLPGMYLAAVERQGEALVAVGPEQRLVAEDRLVFVGVVDSIVDLQRINGLAPATNQVFKLNGFRHDRCHVEAVVSNTCPIVGQTIRGGKFRSRYDAAVIAVHRNGERIHKKIGDIVLRAGDTLLLETHPNFLKYHRNSRDFFLTSPVENSQLRRHERGWVALSIVAGMVAVVGLESYTGIGILNGALIAAALMVATRCCSIEQARRSLDWPLLIAIGSSLAIGRAIETSGLAGAMASWLVGSAASNPWLVLAQVYLATLLVTETVTNNAAAAIMFPIGYATAGALGVSVMPFVIAVVVAASAGFATPLGYQTHLMIFGPGGYRFGDFVRIGLPLDLVVMAVTLAVTPIVFPF